MFTAAHTRDCYLCMMQQEPCVNRDRYYTAGHEWIDFCGSVAYAGVGTFKLTGFKVIENITLTAVSGTKAAGDVLAIIRYKDYLIDVCMPVAGEITAVNDWLINGNKNMLTEHAETDAWLFKISPVQPCDRKGLIAPGEYRMKWGRSKVVLNYKQG